MKRLSILASALLVALVGCQGGGGIDDYARVIVRNASDSEAVTIEVTDSEGEVVISELLEPNASANARSALGSHTATATVAGQDGADAATFTESFEAETVNYITYNSASDEAEAGLSVSTRGFGGGGDDGDEDEGDEDDGETEDESETGDDGEVGDVQ